MALPEQDDGDSELPATFTQRAHVALGDYLLGVRILQWTAVVALVFWLVGVVLAAWATWEDGGHASFIGGWVAVGGDSDGSGLAGRIRAVLLAAVAGSNPVYLLVFTVAFVSSFYFLRSAADAAGPTDDKADRT